MLYRAPPAMVLKSTVAAPVLSLPAVNRPGGDGAVL